MRLSIEKMRLENFKGVRELELDFSETRTAIFGANGTGKTTIPDAFCWVLYNTDSHGNAPGSDNFREKPLDADGHEVHNLDTCVELKCKLDGLAFNLKRLQRENWVKKRGGVDLSFQGNVSTYWINGVETALKDFRARIAEIAPDDVIKLIGTLSAFNSQNWKKRREQLLALSGRDVDSEMLARDEYRQLADECANRNIGIDDLRKVLVDQRKRTNSELQMIPVRIDEATKALPVFKPQEVSNAEFIVKDNSEAIERINGYIAEAKASAGDNAVMCLIGLENELNSLTKVLVDKWVNGRADLEKQRDAIADSLRRSMEYKSANAMQMEAVSARLKNASDDRDRLRAAYLEERATVFTWDTTNDVCPTCGQVMPKEKLEEAKENAEQKFNSEKRGKLDEIKKRGAVCGAEVKALDEQLAFLIEEEGRINAKIQDATNERDTVSEALKKYPEAPDFSVNPRIEELRKQIAEVQAQSSQSPDEKVAGLMSRRAELQQQLEEKRSILAKRDAAIETEKRISDLEMQQKQKGIELARIEQLIALAERFVTDRCAALEDSINACFPTVRWKLFDVQINGGIADVCNCMIPCESGLVAYESANTAAQVNADLEIINVLSEHYDVFIPLFVDGAESINVLNHTDSQLITLSVSLDPELTIKKEVA